MDTFADVEHGVSSSSKGCLKSKQNVESVILPVFVFWLRLLIPFGRHLLNSACHVAFDVNVIASDWIAGQVT